MTNDELLSRAVLAEGSQRDELLGELFDRLRYGDEPEEYRVPMGIRTARITLWCFTCGFTTSQGDTDERETEHRRFDGAHEAHWYTDDETLISNTLDLISYFVRMPVA